MTRPPAQLLHTKNETDRAGAILAAGDSSLPGFAAACAVACDWRNAHAYPLNYLQITLRRHVQAIDAKALVSQRLKRLASIRRKLERFPQMQLSRIQDLGGCRAIVADCRKVRQLQQRLLKSRWKHELVKVHDYLAAPKASGYRGIHLVYRYRSDQVPALNGLLIEIQLRSRLQHAWATAVETIGILLNQSLKSSQGEAEWLKFFTLVSSAFARREGETAIPGTPEGEILHAEIRRSAAALDVVAKLSHFNQLLRISQEETAKQKKIETLVLYLDTAINALAVWKFGPEEAEAARTRYSEMEKSIGDNPRQDVVLVSVSSLQKLREAYPNYFLDTKHFVHELNKIIGES